MTSTTTWGWATNRTWEPSCSVIVAPARIAIERTTSAPAALSPVDTTAQDGRVFHAGGPFFSEKPSDEAGRWVAAMTAACSGDRSAAKTSWNLSGLMKNSVSVPPDPFGY